MPRGPTLRKADLDRVLKALKDAGQEAASVVVRPGGEVVITPRAIGAAGDGLTDDTPGGDVSDLERFRREKLRRGLRAAEGS